MNAMRYVKAAAANAVAGTLVNILIAWEKGWNWSIVGFAVNVALFTAFGVGARYLLDTRRLPHRLLRLLDRLAAATWSDIRRVAVKAVRGHRTLVFGILSVVVWGSLAPTPESLSEPARAIYEAAYKLGTVWVIVSLAWMVITSVIERASPTALAGVLVGQMTMFGLALVSVRTFGGKMAEVLDAVKASPDKALAIVAALVVLRIAFALAPKWQLAAARNYTDYGVVIAGLPKRKRAASDILRTAVHEAGHLLLYACLSELPSRLTVEVLAVLKDSDVYRGQVQHSGEWPDVVTESFNRWAMLMYLAGAEAEYVICGERANGADGDNRNWLNSATHYLTSGFGEVFYAEPTSDAETSHNRAVLNDLKASCVAQLAGFLEANKGLLQEFAAAIVEQKSMSREQIEPYLARVVGIETMPSTAYGKDRP